MSKHTYTDRELHEMYDDFLDDCYGDVKIGGYEYSTSKAMKEVDPIAYRCGFNDWLDSEVESEQLFYYGDEYHYEKEEKDND